MGRRSRQKSEFLRKLRSTGLKKWSQCVMGFLVLKRELSGKRTHEALRDSDTREDEPLSLKSSSMLCRSRSDSRTPGHGLAE
jgi:hypothetical protein